MRLFSDSIIIISSDKMLAIPMSYRNIVIETYEPPGKKLEAICPLTLPTSKSNIYFIATCSLFTAVAFLLTYMKVM